MKFTISIVMLLCSLPVLAQPAAPPADWKEFNPLIGEWVADPAGPNDTTRGGFVVESALAGRILVRKNWAEYAQTKERPASRHDDLMVILKDGGGKTQPLLYDQAAAAWRTRYRVPLHPATERFGLSVTAKNAQKLQQRVWVFLQVQEAAAGEAAGTAAEPDSQ